MSQAMERWVWVHVTALTVGVTVVVKSPTCPSHPS